MDFIRLGGHIITPERNEFTTPHLPARFDVLNTARMLENQLKEVEALCEESKVRRADNRKRAAALDKVLTSLRIQEQKERDTTLKLSKSWAKISGIEFSNQAPASIVQAYGATPHHYLSDIEAIAPAREPRSFLRTCYTNEAASSFNDYHERYRDSYTFSEPAWQPTCMTTQYTPSANKSTPNVDGYAITGSYPWFDSSYDDSNNSFTFSAPHWRTGAGTSTSQGERSAHSVGIEYDDPTGNQWNSPGNSLSTSSTFCSVPKPQKTFLNDARTPGAISVGRAHILSEDVGGSGTGGRKRGRPDESNSVREYSYGKKQGWKRTKISMSVGDHESESAMLIADGEVMGTGTGRTGRVPRRQRSKFGNRPWRNRRKPCHNPTLSIH